MRQCPSIPKKIEVEVVEKKNSIKKKEPIERDYEAELKALRSKLRQSQMRTRQVESIIASSMFSALEKMEHHRASVPPTVSFTSEDAPDKDREAIVRQLAEASRNADSVDDIYKLRRMEKEMQLKLNINEEKIEQLKSKAKALQNRYSKIRKDIDRQIWKASISNDQPRKERLKELQLQQKGKYDSLMSDYSFNINSLTTENEQFFERLNEVEEDIQFSSTARGKINSLVSSLSPSQTSLQ